jgi:hypothetical protein
MILMQLNLAVPPGVTGYVFDFAFFTSEHEDNHQTQYADMFVAWSTSDSFTGSVTHMGQFPTDIPGFADANAWQFIPNAPALVGTGFENNYGTGWFEVRGSADPGEDLQLSFFLADRGDSIVASAAMLDNFRWECTGCTPSQPGSCGLQPQ